MAIRRIRKGDEVIVLTGRNRGQRGNVLSVDIGKDRVVVEGINIVKRHTKPNPQKGTTGGIIEKEMPVHVSNVALFNPVTGKVTRSASRGWKTIGRFGVFKSTEEVVDL